LFLFLISETFPMVGFKPTFFGLEKVVVQYGYSVHFCIVLLPGGLALQENTLFGLPFKTNSYVPKHSVPSILYSRGISTEEESRLSLPSRSRPCVQDRFLFLISDCFISLSDIPLSNSCMNRSLCLCLCNESSPRHKKYNREFKCSEG
jgi:hypothetical protein